MRFATACLIGAAASTHTTQSDLIGSDMPDFDGGCAGLEYGSPQQLECYILQFCGEDCDFVNPCANLPVEAAQEECYVDLIEDLEWCSSDEGQSCFDNFATDRSCAWSDDECWAEYYSDFDESSFDEHDGEYSSADWDSEGTDCDYEHSDDCWVEFYGIEGPDCGTEDEECWDAFWNEWEACDDDACWAQFYGGETPDCADDDEECWDAWWEQHDYSSSDDYATSSSSSDEDITADLPEPECADDDMGCFGMYLDQWYDTLTAGADDFDCTDLAELDQKYVDICRSFEAIPADHCAWAVQDIEVHMCYEHAM